MQQKILLVDDREDNLFSMETILEADNYTLIKASSGREALKILLKEVDFALILMDVKMPNLNGFETAALIYEREKLRHIPIIFITANLYGEENIFKGYRTGAVDYIYKPINPELLRAKVSVFVELYEKNRQLLLQEQRLTAINRSLQNEIREREASEQKIRELNEELLRNIAHLEAANQDLDRFAFMASHDMQEPLRKIRMFTDLVLSKNEKGLDEQAKQQLNKIQAAAGRMQSLIKDILMFSRISVNQEPMVETQLKKVIESAMEDLKPLVEEKNAVVSIDELPSAPVNPRLLALLFNNLLSNSLKYSRKEEPPMIRIRSDITQASRSKNIPAENYVRIFVEDNGIGFDQHNAEYIFGMFRRLHHNTEYEGTGIGLALCKKIAEVHNGFISAKSKPGKGSTFIVAIPMQSTVVPEPEKVKAEPTRSAAKK